MTAEILRRVPHKSSALENGPESLQKSDAKAPERLADYVRQETIALQPALCFREPLGMNEDECLQLFGLLPKWIKLRSGEFFAVDAATDQATAHILLLHALFQLIRGQL